IEAKLGLTRSILKYLATLMPQPRITLLTRSPIVERDVDIFRRFDDFRIHLSVTTDDDEVRKAFEPGCASIRRRLESLETLIESGVRAAANVCPLLPMRDPLAFSQKLFEIGVERIWVSGFHEGSGPFSSGTRDAAKRIAAQLGWS